MKVRHTHYYFHHRLERSQRRSIFWLGESCTRMERWLGGMPKASKLPEIHGCSFFMCTFLYTYIIQYDLHIYFPLPQACSSTVRDPLPTCPVSTFAQLDAYCSRHMISLKMFLQETRGRVSSLRTRILNKTYHNTSLSDPSLTIMAYGTGESGAF